MRRLDGDDGFTVVELMVGVALTTALAAATLGSLIAVQRALHGAAQRDAELGQARVAINEMERQLRGALRPPTAAPLFEVAGPNEVLFYSVANSPRDLSTAAPSSQGPVPKRVRLWLDGGALMQQVTEPSWDAGVANWTYSSAPGPARVLARGVVPQPGGLFTYHCTRAVPDATCADAGQAPANAIAVTLTVPVQVAGGSDDTLLTTRARLVNLEL